MRFCNSIKANVQEIKIFEPVTPNICNIITLGAIVPYQKTKFTVINKNTLSPLAFIFAIGYSTTSTSTGIKFLHFPKKANFIEQKAKNIIIF